MHDQRKELDLFTKDNPYSLINRVPLSIATAMKAVPEDFWNKPISHFEAMIEKMKMDRDIRRLRTAFWHEVLVSESRKGMKMHGPNIYAGVMGKTRFRDMINNSHNVVYMCTPPIDYTVAMEELFQFSLERMRDIMNAPILDKKGHLLTATARLQVDVFKMVTERTRGPVVQKLESKNLNVTQQISSRDVEELSVEEMQSRIAEKTQMLLGKDISPKIVNPSFPIKESSND